MQMGLGVVGAVYTNKSEATLNDTVPIAKLIEESEAIVVPKDSPYDTLDQLVAAWKADPGKVPVGGASNPGGPDHLTPMLLAKAVGVTPKDVNYVAYDGGGELLTGDPRQEGRLRRHRHRRGRRAGQGRRREDPRRHQRRAGRGHRRPDPQGARASTWSSPTGAASSARPGSREAKTKEYIDLLTKMHDSPAVEEDPGRPGLDRRVPDRRRVQDLPHRRERPRRRRPQGTGPGLMSSRTQQTARGGPLRVRGGPPPRRPRRVGDRRRAPAGATPLSRGPGQRQTVPSWSSACCSSRWPSCSSSTSLRGGRGEPEGGEDVDLSHGSDWRTIGLLVGGLRLQRAAHRARSAGRSPGRCCSSATTFALGARHYVRMAVIAVVLSVGSWYLFFLGLGIKLPVGLLKGIL